MRKRDANLLPLLSSDAQVRLLQGVIEAHPQGKLEVVMPKLYQVNLSALLALEGCTSAFFVAGNGVSNFLGSYASSAPSFSKLNLTGLMVSRPATGNLHNCQTNIVQTACPSRQNQN
eukprot:6340001-Amphidinium_carterae.1